jgi:hypothetical protein
MTATASSITATRIEKTPAFLIAYLAAEAITQAVIAKRIIYGRMETRVVEGRGLNSFQD